MNKNFLFVSLLKNKERQKQPKTRNFTFWVVKNNFLLKGEHCGGCDFQTKKIF